ncbi:hypothetical protein H5410_025814 [Solanum commersonii]|uniref:F-box domain-containing protein n=1 Tax=Solanum commersonii TaxID=4109 RepID=A0A9J5YV94_SOLCO|nr:hypothetical protein H5410_025814 [Solanum commersonii]
MASIVCDDILSELPNDIGLNILSCLNLKERATACFVSRNWHYMITSLDNRKFVRTHHDSHKYCGYCYRDKLESCINCHTLRPIIVKLASDNTTITEFYLLVPITLLYFQFSLAVFESRLLTVLHLKYCRIDENDIKNIIPCLKEIYFDHVGISSSTLSNFINTCPFIVELTLMSCSYLYSVSVPHQNQLKKVHMNCCRRYLKEIEIKARNLLEFHLFNSSAELEVDLCACTKLQVLNLNCVNIPHRFRHEVSSIKSLCLPLCKGLNKIKIMSPELESLSLIDVLDLDDAFIVNPILHWFKIFDSFIFQNSCALVCSKLMEVEMGLNYVGAIIKFNDMLSLGTDTTESMEVISHSGNLRSNFEPLRFKNIDLKILMPWIPRYESLIDELISYFYPRALLVLLDELKNWKRKSESSKRCTSIREALSTKGFIWTVYRQPVFVVGRGHSEIASLDGDQTCDHDLSQIGNKSIELQFIASIALDGIFSVLPNDIRQKILSSLVSRKWHHMITSLDDRKFLQTHQARIQRKLRLLTVLYVIYCNVDEDDSKEFHCLKGIYFDHVSISRTTFSHFIDKCPSIVELTLIDCFYLYSILLCPNLNQHKKFEICLSFTCSIHQQNWKFICPLNIKGEFPKSVRMDIVNEATGKMRTEVIQIRYDYVPKYCE